MATTEEKSFLSQTGLEALITNIKQQDTSTLAAAKTYADDLGDNYDPAGTAQTKMQELANGQVAANTAVITKLNGEADVTGSVANTVKAAKDELSDLIDAVDTKADVNADHIGIMGNLSTTAKADLVSSINEVRAAISAGGTASAITIDTTTTTAGAAKSYTIKQGTTTIGVIDIPKDMVVQNGEVVTNPEGQPEGTYIVLTLANATNDKVYVNVGTLVDIYTAQKNATKIQLAINSTTREISASIVAGSITDVDLASNAVTTVKIADGNVTKAKLSTDVQTSLGKADVAEANAKSYTDTEIGKDRTRITAAETAISGLGSRVTALENVTWTEITAAEVNAMFSA